MAITFRTAGVWGPGQGSNLSAAQVDTNFYELLQLISDLTSNPAEPVQITNFSVAGSRMTITLSDSSSYVVTIPTFSFRWEDEYVGLRSYLELDIFTVLDDGVYLVLKDHISPAIFNPNLLDIDSNPVYKKMFGAVDTTAYDIGFCHASNIPGDHSVLLQFSVTRDMRLPKDLEGSRTFLGVAASVETQAFEVIKADVLGSNTVIGLITFTPGALETTDGGQSGTYASAVDYDFVPGDRIIVRAPSIVDATAANFSLTLMARLL